MSLDAIPIHVINAPPIEAGLTGNAPPLLRELAEQVKRLLATGEASAIDLSALPLTPADLDWLREKLGAGEISVTLQANGESTLNETACPGVWWVTHHNERGAVTSQLIEVALVPELVKAHPQDVQIGYEYLELVLSDL
ncbi:MAG: hydrogenase expression/formation protein [Thiobacillus sp.]|uniref:hydrogenase expression/formation protein n=1 Tax=Thiobacillus sp. TaxID=924 RepID=UPI00273527CC|nr:hydrogenase expression/formation protein [Thiobacillus sp.]MDP3420198.1 hydrogenase expression/formation protein [Thiobacillus sp.]MDP3586149.1 hydrogenase expression/formation protein [Thiobacillus sp.]